MPGSRRKHAGQQSGTADQADQFHDIARRQADRNVMVAVDIGRFRNRQSKRKSQSVIPTRKTGTMARIAKARLNQIMPNQPEKLTVDGPVPQSSVEKSECTRYQARNNEKE